MMIPVVGRSLLYAERSVYGPYKLSPTNHLPNETFERIHGYSIRISHRSIDDFLRREEPNVEHRSQA